LKAWDWWWFIKKDWVLLERDKICRVWRQAPCGGGIKDEYT